MSRTMKDSGIAWLGDIPEHWETAPVKSLFNRRSQRNNPVVSTERLSLSIDKGVTLYADKTTNLDRFKDDFTQYQLAYPNDIVLNCMNMIVGAIGLSKYFGCVSPVYYVIYPQNDNINVQFYSYLLNITSIKDLYRSLGKGIYAIDRGDGRVNTCRLKVSYSDFGAIEIPLPPTIKEQQAIADFLDAKCAEVDELIALQEKIIDELKFYKQAVITEAVNKGLNPNAPMKDSGVEWAKKVPQHWEICKIKNLFKTISGATPKTDYTPFWDGNIIWITPADYKTEDRTIFSGRRNITMEGVNSCGTTVVPSGSIIFSKRAPIGLVAMNEVPLCTNQGCLSCIPNRKSNVQFYYFLMSVLSEQFELLGSGTTFKEISTSSFANFLLIAPPIKEQKQIADYLDQKCTEIDKLSIIKQQKIDELKEYKKSIIYEYVTGKKQVKM